MLCPTNRIRDPQARGKMPSARPKRAPSMREPEVSTRDALSYARIGCECLSTGTSPPAGEAARTS